jgi:hypothetical protein
VCEPALCRWLVKQGSLVKNLKERFATLQIGPNSTVIFDYKKEETSPTVKGMYTLGAAAKCLPGAATFPYPADLVMKLEVGDGKAHVFLCFDNQDELLSFKSAVEFGLNSENYMKTHLAHKDAEFKLLESQRVLRQQEDKANAITLESQIAHLQQLAAENEAANAQIEMEQQMLRKTMGPISAEKQTFEQEQSSLLASASQDLLKTRLSLNEVATHTESTIDSSMQASPVLAQTESCTDSEFAALRHHESPTSVPCAVRETDSAHRVELETSRNIALEREELDYQTKVLAEQQLKAVEMADLRMSEAEECEQEQEPARSLSDIRDVETAVEERAKAGGQVKERVKRLSGSGSPEVSQQPPSQKLLTDAAVVPLKERLRHLAESSSAEKQQKDPSLDAAVVPLKERLRHLAESSSAEKQQKDPSLDAAVVPLKERLRHLAESSSAEQPQQKPIGNKSLPLLSEQDMSTP